MLNQIAGYFFLFVTTGIPFVFHYWIQKNPGLTAEKITARCTWFALANFACLFLSSFVSLTPANPNTMPIQFGASLFSFMFLLSFRSKALDKARKTSVNPKTRLMHSIRTFLAISFVFGLYQAVLYGLSPFITSVGAMVFAFASIVGAAPIMVRIMFPSTRMHDSTFKEEIRALFATANVRVSEIYILNTDRIKISNALVCGSKWGFGPFRRSLFISESLFSALNEDELKAVFLHEASHFQLHHIAKRGFASFCAVLFSIVAVGVPLSLMIMLFYRHPTAEVTVTGCAFVLNIVFQIAFTFRVIRKQEFEADLNAVKLGAAGASLVSALEKLTALNGGSEKAPDRFTNLLFGSGHPSVEERKEAIAANALPKSANLFPHYSSIAAYATVVLVLFGAVMVSDPTSNAGLNRTIASELQKELQPE